MKGERDKMKTLSEIHNCKKSQGKIVSITIDKVGVTRCGYCNQIVDYTDYFRYQEAKRVIEQLKLNRGR